MKRGIPAVLVLGMLMCVGCITTAPPDSTKMTVKAAPYLPPPPPPPVTPDRITPTNGHLIAQKLSDELDYESRLAAMPAH